MEYRLRNWNIFKECKREGGLVRKGIGKGLYNWLKKITVLICITTVCSIIFTYFFVSWLQGNYSWKEMELEYIGEIEFHEPDGEKSERISPAASDGRFIACIDNPEEYDFFQIRSEDDWRYVCLVFNLEENDKDGIQFDFSAYYLIGIRVRISDFQYINEEWMLDSHWVYTKVEEDVGSFEKGILYVYKMPEKIRL